MHVFNLQIKQDHIVANNSDLYLFNPNNDKKEWCL